MRIPEFSEPTSAQIDYDIDDYDFDAMSCADVSELIQELKNSFFRGRAA